MVNKELLLEHILKSDLTATEKRYLEKLIDSKNHQNWISVNDRLPEQPPNIRNSQGQEFATKRMPCIVSAKLSKYLSKITAAYFDFYDSCFYDPNSFNKLDVTHWRTFPEPPEGE